MNGEEQQQSLGYTMAETGRAVGISRSWIWHLVQRGDIAVIAHPISRRKKRIPESEFQRLKAHYATQGKRTWQDG